MTSDSLFYIPICSVVLMTVYPTLIAPLFNKYTKLEDGEVMTAIEALAKKVSFPLTQVRRIKYYLLRYMHTYIHTFKGLSS